MCAKRGLKRHGGQPIADGPMGECFKREKHCFRVLFLMEENRRKDWAAHRAEVHCEYKSPPLAAGFGATRSTRGEPVRFEQEKADRWHAARPLS